MPNKKYCALCGGRVVTYFQQYSSRTDINETWYEGPATTFPKFSFPTKPKYSSCTFLKCEKHWRYSFMTFCGFVMVSF